MRFPFFRPLPPLLVVSLLSAAALTLLWLLSPTRSTRASPPGVVEISYMGPGGPVSGALDDAVRAFEEESRFAHAGPGTRPPDAKQ